MILILDHIRSTVDRFAAGLFFQIGTGPTVPVIRLIAFNETQHVTVTIE